jgi:aspartate carbamoyltransferase catalytic subunit
MTNLKFLHHNLLSIEQLSVVDVEQIFITAAKYLAQENLCTPILQSKKVINLFFENSTRTLTSFEIAAKSLKANVVNIQVAHSSINKGESLVDTVKNLDAMKADFMVVRHSASGAVAVVQDNVTCSVINAGDGAHQHPTQALLDAFTIKLKFDKIAGLNIAICGDILHSRVARSNIMLLTMLGANIRLIAPPTLLPFIPSNLPVDIFYDMKQGLKDVDVIMVLRLQRERMQSSFVPSLGEFFSRYGLTRNKLAYANSHAIVMHPGPINRNVEIETSLVDSDKGKIILEQVTNGVAIRSAIFELIQNAKEQNFIQ